MQPSSRLVVLQRGAPFSDLIRAQAQVFGVDPQLVFAVAAQESAFEPAACRREPGFWRRYGAGTLRNIAASLTTTDDIIARDFPELLFYSFGLMQVMGSVALEVGMRFPSPTYLCVPTIGIEAGCRVLRRCFAGGQPTVDALLAYNGGGDPHYPDRVLVWRSEALAAGCFAGWA